MTESISHKLYRWILGLYPEPFRNEFGDEMLSMLPECEAAQGFWHVLADVLFSAAKQHIQYLSTRAPNNAPLYSEIAWSPDLARILAVIVFSAVLIASALTGRAKSETRKFWTGPLRLERTCGNPDHRAGYSIPFRNSTHHE